MWASTSERSLAILDHLKRNRSVNDSDVQVMAQRALWPLTIKALPALYGAGLVLFVIRVLPTEEFGQYGIAFAYVNLLAVLTRGLWIIPLITWSARGETKSILNPVFWLSTGSATVAAVSALLVLPKLGLDYRLSVMAAAMLILTVPRELGYALSQASGRYGITALIESTYFVGSLVGFAILYVFNRLGSASSAMSVNILCILLSVCVTFIIYPHLLRPAFGGNWKEVFSYGKWIGVMSLSEVYFQQGDAVLLGALVRPAELAPFLAARTLLRLYALFSQAINFLTLPVSARLHAAGHVDKLRRKVNVVIRTLLIALVPLNLIAFFASPYLLPWLLGEKYSSTVPFFLMLLPITFFEPIYSIYSNVLAGIGRPDVVAKIVPWVVILNIAGNVAVISHFGLKAAPFVLVASHLLLAIFLASSSKRYLRERSPDFATASSS